MTIYGMGYGAGTLERAVLEGAKNARTMMNSDV